MAGEWLAATTNTNMFTYEIAPVFIMMEHEVFKVIYFYFELWIYKHVETLFLYTCINFN